MVKTIKKFLRRNSRLISAYRLSKQAFGQYKRKIVLLTGLGLLSGLFEGFGINAIIPLLSYATNEQGASDNVMTEIMENFFGFLGIEFNVLQILIFIIFTFILKTIILILSGYIQAKIVTDYEKETREKLLKNTLLANWPYLMKQKLGHLETVILLSVGRGSVMLRNIGSIIITLTGVFMYTLVAINISLNVTLLTFALGGFLFLLLKPLIYKTKVLAERSSEINKDMTHHISENVTGMKSVKSMFAINGVYNSAKEYFEELRSVTIKSFLVRQITGAVLQPVGLIFICAIFALSYYQIVELKLASLTAIVYLIYRIFIYFNQGQNILHAINSSIPFLKDVLKYETESKASKEELSEKKTKFKFSKELSFENVNFSYGEEGKDILSDINFKIKHGEMVGLIGLSGSGKTTITDLILRLLKPTRGKILIDDVDIEEVDLKNLRNNIGYVSQDMFLINDTIENNIRFYNKEMSQEDIEEAVKKAGIYDFIQDLPEKLNTIIGERGTRLSAGQRQRIVIARVLARKPKLLILDEATSALDNESEKKIQESISKLKGEITIIAIAHRLSTLTEADNLLVLENGKIMEQGKPKELLADKKSYFYKVYNIRG